jgi:hypothetical protein
MTSPTKEEQEKHHQWIYEETAEMSDLLGINTPQIKIVGVDLDAVEVIANMMNIVANVVKAWPIKQSIK